MGGSTRDFIRDEIDRDARDWERAHGSEAEHLRHQLGVLGEQLAAAERERDEARAECASLRDSVASAGMVAEQRAHTVEQAEARAEAAERRLAVLEKLRRANQLRCDDWAGAAYRLPPESGMRESIEGFADIMGRVIAQAEQQQGGGQQ